MIIRNQFMISTLAILLMFAAGESAAQTKKNMSTTKNANTSRPKSATEPKAKPTKPKPAAKSAGAAIFVVTQDRSGAHIEPLVGNRSAIDRAAFGRIR